MPSFADYLDDPELQSGNISKTLKEIEEPDENEVGTIESVLSGIASGVIKIPEGVVSLGAELYDLGADTNTAAQVEKFFDDLNIFDEAAEATAAGKITETLVNVGVPGGFAFTKGASLAGKAIRAKKAKKYFSTDKKNLDPDALKDLRQQATTLNKKEKLAKYTIGTLGSGFAEAAFVADVDKVGTFGDLIGGPTELERGTNEDVTRDLINRVKFGTEGALFSGLIGGVGATMKAIAKRNAKDLAIDGTTDKIIESISSAFRARGKRTKEFFKEERTTIGLRAADVNKAQRIARETTKAIDKLFPSFKGIYNQTTQKQKKELNKKLNDLLLSGKPRVLEDKQGVKVLFGDWGTKQKDELTEILKQYGAKPKQIDTIFNGFNDIRKSWGDMFSSVGYMLKGESPEKFTQFQKNFAEKFKEYLGGTYDVFVNKPLLPFMSYTPAREAVNKAVNMFMQSGTATREQAEKYVSEIVKTARLPKALTFTDTRNPDPLFRLALRPTLKKGEKESPLFRFLRGGVSSEVLEKIQNKEGAKSLISLKFIPNKKDIKVGTKPNGEPIYQSKREIIEELFGKVENPTQTILAGTERISGISRINDFYRNIKSESDKLIQGGKRGMFYDDEFSAEEIFGVGNVQKVFNDPNRVFEIGSGNPLSGTYTSKGIAEALEIGEKSFITNPVASFIYDSLVLIPKATSQIAKTILSPITHVRNFVSAGAFATAQGLIPGVTVSPIKMGQAFKEAYSALQTPLVGTRKQNEFYEELLELGVVNNNVRLGDLRRLLDDLNFGEAFNNRKGLNLLMSPFKKIMKGSQDLYTAEDDIWKITTWALEKDRIKSAYLKAGIKQGDEFIDAAGNLRKMDDRFLKEEAANIVKNNLPNYDYVGDFIKGLRKFPLGNFVSFPAEILRTGTNIVQRALREINYTVKNTDGKMVKPLAGIGYKRLFGFGTTVTAIPYVTVEAAKSIYNVSEDELQALRRYVPEWSKNSTIVPIRDEETGKLKYVDFSHGNAYDTLIRPIQTVINAVAEGRTDEDGIMDDFAKGLFVATNELASPFISESIWTEAATDILVRKGRTRDFKEIYNPKAPWGEKVKNIVSHLVESQTPGSWQALKRLDFAIEPIDVLTKGKYDEYGQSFEFGDEFAGIFGFRAVEVDPLRSFNFKIADYTNGIKDSRKLFTSELLKGGPVSPGDIVDRYLIANEASFKTKKDFFEDYLAAIKLKANKSELDDKVIERLGRKDLRNLQKGVFSPLSISDKVEEKFEENARNINEPNPYTPVKPYIKTLQSILKNVPIRLTEFPTFRNPFKELELKPTDTTYLPSSGQPTVSGQPTTSGLNIMQKARSLFGPFDKIFGGQ